MLNYPLTLWRFSGIIKQINGQWKITKFRIPTGRGRTIWGSLGISGWGCAAGTLEPLTYTRASSAEFCYPILE